LFLAVERGPVETLPIQWLSFLLPPPDM
jgi:hypothetical protein